MIKKVLGFLLLLSTLGIFPFDKVYSKEAVFKWGISEDAYEISYNFRERLAFSMLQENVRYRLVSFLIDQDIPHRLFVEAKLLPCQFSLFFDESVGKEDLQSLLFKESSWFLEEFESVKLEWLKRLAEEEVFCGLFESKDVLCEAIKISQEISQNELVKLFQKSKNLPPPYLIQNYLEDREDVFDLPSEKLFFSLSLREEDQVVINQFVLCLANKNIFQIIADRASLEATKNKLKLVHPFRFIEFALKDNALRSALGDLYKSDFKWSFLTAGLERSFRRKKEAQALNEYVLGFSNLLGVDELEIQKYIDKGDFKGMISYLIDLKT